MNKKLLQWISMQLATCDGWGNELPPHNATVPPACRLTTIPRFGRFSQLHARLILYVNGSLASCIISTHERSPWRDSNPQR